MKIILALAFALISGRLAAQTVIAHGGDYQDQGFFNPVVSEHAVIIKTDQPVVFRRCTFTGCGPGVSAILCTAKAHVTFIDCLGLGNNNSAFLELRCFQHIGIDGGQLIGWSEIIQLDH